MIGNDFYNPFQQPSALQQMSSEEYQRYVMYQMSRQEQGVQARVLEREEPQEETVLLLLEDI